METILFFVWMLKIVTFIHLRRFDFIVQNPISTTRFKGEISNHFSFLDWFKIGFNY